MTVASLENVVAGDSRGWVGVLFATHRRVAVRTPGGGAGPEFCTCGDVWPCRREELAARILDFPSGPEPGQALGHGGTSADTLTESL